MGHGITELNRAVLVRRNDNKGKHMEKSNLATLSKTLPDATEYPPMVCGSCHWRREKAMFGRPSAICVVMPKQVIAIAQSQGAQILSVNPVIEDLATETCAMWKPLEGDTQ
jgi:hypothetical protein